MPSAFTHARPSGSQPIASGSKPRTGSKLKHTLAIASPAKPSPGAGKRKRLPRDNDDGEDDDGDASLNGASSIGSAAGSDDDDEEEDGGMDTGDEITAAKEGKGSKKQKTKRKAPTTASTFGSTLTSLLADPISPSGASSKKPKTTTSTKTKQQPILSLSRAPLPPSKVQVNLERKAARVLKQEKAEREDRARVRDVIEGWAPAPSVGRGGGEQVGSQEFEKALRKTAQRGVIKLFNAIIAASKAAEELDISLSAQAGVKAEPGRRKEKDNVLGRGAKEELTKESFLELVKKGGR